MPSLFLSSAYNDETSAASCLERDIKVDSCTEVILQFFFAMLSLLSLTLCVCVFLKDINHSPSRHPDALLGVRQPAGT